MPFCSDVTNVSLAFVKWGEGLQSSGLQLTPPFFSFSVLCVALAEIGSAFG